MAIDMAVMVCSLLAVLYHFVTAQESTEQLAAERDALRDSVRQLTEQVQASDERLQQVFVSAWRCCW